MRNAKHKIATSLALCLGLALGAAPGHGQDSGEFQTTGGKKKHRKRQERPIQLGTSGSNAEDLTLEFCCNGTLGALIEKSGVQYVLGNNHVLGRRNRGVKGEAIIQPGYSDQSCPATDEAFDTVAHLSAKKKLKFGLDRRNKVDVAIAEVVPGAVRADGEILQIGIPGSDPVEAFALMRVKKSGRTTGLTRGIVESVGNTVLVEIELECGSEETKVARFKNQIFIRDLDNRSFNRAGDSGSMVYEDVDDCPAPVGLLFAGGGSLTAINPASAVLKTVGRLKPRGEAQFVGCESSPFETASGRSPLLRPERVREAAAVKQSWEDHLLNLPSVQSLGIGVTLEGPLEPAIYIYTTDSRDVMLDRLPESLDGFRIEVVETEKFVATCGH